MRTLAFILIILLTPFCVAKGVVTAAQDPWPPFVQAGKVRYAGISVDVVQEALRTQGYALRMTIMPWSEALENVKQGKIDLLVATWFTEARTDFLRYSNPYMQNELKFIMPADSNFSYSGLDSLKGKKVGVVEGYGYGEEFLNASHFTRVVAKDTPTNLRKLLAGHIDMTLDDAAVAKMQIQGSGLKTSQFKFSKKNLSTNDLHVTTGLSNPRSEELIKAFDKGLKEIKANGTFDKLLKRYGLE